MKRILYHLPGYAGILSCLLFLFSCVPPQETRDQADKHFDSGRYEEALQLWYAMSDDGHHSAALYYNIGLGESQTGRLPQAIMAYEKALRIRPADARVKQALQEERDKLEQATIPVASFFLSRWYTSALALFRPGVWAWFGLLLLLLAVAGWLDSVRNKPKLSLGRRVIRFLTVGGVVMLLCAGLTYQQWFRTNEAIVMKVCELQQAPSADSPSIRTLSAGEKIKLRDQINDWYQVSLLNYDLGWVNAEDFELIRMGK